MKYCRYCGAELTDDAKYCSKCGKKVDGSNFKESFSENMSDDLRNGLSNKKIEKENVSKKSRVVAAVLAFFLGIFGIHRIYLDIRKSGITMLVVSVVSFVLYFIVGFAIAAILSPLMFENAINSTDFSSIIGGSFFLTLSTYALLSLLIIVDFILWIIAIIDFVKILLGEFKDGEGKNVINW